MVLGVFPKYHRSIGHTNSKRDPKTIPHIPHGGCNGLAPATLGSIPKREEPGKTGAPCVKVPGSSRVPPLALPFCSPSFFHTISLPPRSLVRDEQTHPHRPRLNRGALHARLAMHANAQTGALEASTRGERERERNRERNLLTINICRTEGRQVQRLFRETPPLAPGAQHMAARICTNAVD